jgi:uncharacterized damage-inducible protein DinB
MHPMPHSYRWVAVVVSTWTLAVVAPSLGAAARAPQNAPNAPAAAKPAADPGANPVSQAIRDAWRGARRNLQDSATEMSEANYGFKPVDQVRTFGQILAHVAGANYVFCSAARGEKSPFAEDHFEKTATTKAAIVKALNDSIAYCDAAYDRLTDKSAGETIGSAFGSGQATRATALLGNTGHNQEHYGNLVTYFRIKGLVPPSSRR